jgi:dUTP pyrophosphatase
LGLILANGIGIIDSDYYNNPDNEGHIMFQVYNIKRPLPENTVVLHKGDRIGQGVFVRYGLTDDDMVERVRTGGFGSTTPIDIDLFTT